jgi:beta-1,4-N-acetylglucosaminyltransferase
MIFVTVGACQWPFDRLLVALDRLELNEPLLVQHGPSECRPTKADCVDFLPFERLVEEVRRARVVVTHGGIGSTLVALANGKRPIVVPRLKRYGEAVDDHQIDSVRRLNEAGLVTAVDDLSDLDAALRNGRSASVGPVQPGGQLADDLREYLLSVFGGMQSARSLAV